MHKHITICKGVVYLSKAKLQAANGKPRLGLLDPDEVPEGSGKSIELCKLPHGQAWVTPVIDVTNLVQLDMDKYELTTEAFFTVKFLFVHSMLFAMLQASADTSTKLDPETIKCVLGQLEGVING